MYFYQSRVSFFLFVFLFLTQKKSGGRKMLMFVRKKRKKKNEKKKQSGKKKKKKKKKKNCQVAARRHFLKNQDFNPLEEIRSKAGNKDKGLQKLVAKVGGVWVARATPLFSRNAGPGSGEGRVRFFLSFLSSFAFPGSNKKKRGGAAGEAKVPSCSRPTKSSQEKSPHPEALLARPDGAARPARPVLELDVEVARVSRVGRAAQARLHLFAGAEHHGLVEVEDCLLPVRGSGARARGEAMGVVCVCAFFPSEVGKEGRKAKKKVSVFLPLSFPKYIFFPLRFLRSR